MTPPSIRNGEICRLLSPWPSSWQLLLAEEVARRMEAEPGVVFEELVAAFELTVIERALNVTGGCQHERRGCSESVATPSRERSIAYESAMVIPSSSMILSHRLDSQNSARRKSECAKRDFRRVRNTVPILER